MIDPPLMPARVATVQRQFSRRAAGFHAHAAIVREVGRRLAERLDLMRLSPEQIVDVGCGAGAGRVELQARYPRARWVGIDASLPMLRARTADDSLWSRWRSLGRGAFDGKFAGKVAALADALPIADGTMDLLFSNLMLHWHPAPHRVFPEWRRVLRPDGLLLFSCFGPDTLKELRAACRASLPYARPLPFVDMHDFGDMMVATGFTNPVMDVETLRLSFADAAAMLREVRALGGNPRDDRALGLPGGAQARALYRALDAERGSDGRLVLSFEVAYGHAWCPTAVGAREFTVSLDQLRTKLHRR